MSHFHAKLFSLDEATFQRQVWASTKVYTGLKRSRRIDILTGNELIEVKNAKYLSNSSQLADFLKIAQQSNPKRVMVLYVRPTTQLTPQLVAWMRENGVLLRYIPQ